MKNPAEPLVVLVDERLIRRASETFNGQQPSLVLEHRRPLHQAMVMVPSALGGTRLDAASALGLDHAATPQVTAGDPAASQVAA